MDSGAEQYPRGVSPRRKHCCAIEVGEDCPWAGVPAIAQSESRARNRRTELLPLTRRPRNSSTFVMRGQRKTGEYACVRLFRPIQSIPEWPRMPVGSRIWRVPQLGEVLSHRTAAHECRATAIRLSGHLRKIVPEGHVLGELFFRDTLFYLEFAVFDA